MKVGNITKAAAFKKFFHLSYKSTQILFFVTLLFNFFMRQTLTDDFWRLHKNMNCAFPLSKFSQYKITKIKTDVVISKNLQTNISEEHPIRLTLAHLETNVLQILS